MNRIVQRAQSRDARRAMKQAERRVDRSVRLQMRVEGHLSYLRHLWWRAWGIVWRGIGREVTR